MDGRRGDPVRLYLVGGFLGAGKTTALVALSRHLAERGQRVALITNDFSSGLVDTATVRVQGIDVREISGGCFCCAFKDFLKATDTLLQEVQPTAIITEPVGSCTSLVATVLKPVRKYAPRYEVMPLSVLVDPQRLMEMSRQSSQNGDLAPGAWSEDVRYLYERQMAEADVLVLTKADQAGDRLLETARAELLRRTHLGDLSPAAIETVSSVTSEGIGDWLDKLTAIGSSGANRLIEVDRERHARADAELGWVNVEAHVALPESAASLDLMALITGFLVRAVDRLNGIAIGHLKVYGEAGGAAYKAGVTHNRQQAIVETLSTNTGPRKDGSALAARLIVNLRAAGAPDYLNDTVCSSLREIASLQRAEVRLSPHGVLRPGLSSPVLRIGDPIPETAD